MSDIEKMQEKLKVSENKKDLSIDELYLEIKDLKKTVYEILEKLKTRNF